MKVTVNMSHTEMWQDTFDMDKEQYLAMKQGQYIEGPWNHMAVGDPNLYEGTKVELDEDAVPIEEVVRQAMEESFEVSELSEERGFYTFDIYPDRHDELSNEKLGEICESEDPRLAFDEWIADYYENAVDYVYNDLINDSCDLLDELDIPYDRDAVVDIVHEMAYPEFPEDYYLQQEVAVDITVDTGDSNYDFDRNVIYPAYGAEPYGKIDKTSSVRWLAKTQGYSVTELKKELAKGDLADPHGFIESLRVELANETTTLSRLYFCATISVDDLITIHEKMREVQYEDGEYIYEASARKNHGYLQISQDAHCGLYDPVYGSGDLQFDIQLDKALRLPIRYIFDAEPDSELFKWPICGTYGWTEGFREVWKPDTVSLHC